MSNKQLRPNNARVGGLPLKQRLLRTEPPEYFSEDLRRDFDKWDQVARDIGFTPCRACGQARFD